MKNTPMSPISEAATAHTNTMWLTPTLMFPNFDVNGDILCIACKKLSYWEAQSTSIGSHLLQKSRVQNLQEFA